MLEGESLLKMVRNKPRERELRGGIRVLHHSLAIHYVYNGPEIVYIYNSPLEAIHPGFLYLGQC
jgi:hypothetical protein